MEDYPIQKIPDTPYWSENHVLAGSYPQAGLKAGSILSLFA